MPSETISSALSRTRQIPEAWDRYMSTNYSDSLERSSTHSPVPLRVFVSQSPHSARRLTRSSSLVFRSGQRGAVLANDLDKNLVMGDIKDWVNAPLEAAAS